MRVLIVEDDLAIAELVRHTLEDAGYAADIATNGCDGLWKAKEQSYCAILLDLLLPGTNGYIICRELRAAGVETPILILTGKHGEYDQVEGLDLGADDYMTKPFSSGLLLARLRALVRRSSQQLSPVLELGGLRLDPRTRRCTRDDVAIELTPREFSLLRYLMSHTGRVVTKNELLSQVWNDEVDSGDVVRVYVGYLRKKIDHGSSAALIQTVRGHGYRMGADRSDDHPPAVER